MRWEAADEVEEGESDGERCFRWQLLVLSVRVAASASSRPLLSTAEAEKEKKGTDSGSGG